MPELCAFARPSTNSTIKAATHTTRIKTLEEETTLLTDKTRELGTVKSHAASLEGQLSSLNAEKGALLEQLRSANDANTDSENKASLDGLRT